MGRTIRLAIFLALLGAPAAALADSPLTSTDFANAYGDVPQVQHARAAGLDAQTIQALRDPAVPNDVRAAIVNSLGWSISGQRNARTFLASLARAYRTTPARLRASRLTPQELFALGYLLAMDDYHQLRAIGGSGELQKRGPAAILAEALRRTPADGAIAAILGLVQAQGAMANVGPGGFCGAWQQFSRGRQHPTAQQSLRPGAWQIIDEYMGGYRSYCGGRP